MTSSKPVSYNLDDNFYTTSKYINYVNLFFIGVIIYSASYILKGNWYLPQKLGELLQLFGFITFLTFSTFLVKFKIRNVYLRILFTVYSAWSVGIIIRGINLNPRDLIGSILTPDHGVLLYFAPLILIFPANFIFFRKTFDTVTILALIFLACTVLFIQKLLDRSILTQEVIEYLARTLAMPCGFILLSYKYHSNKRRFLALMVMMLALLFSIYKARRGLSITLGAILISAYFLFLYHTRIKFFAIYLSILIILLGIFYSTSIYQISNNKILSMIADRGTEDTRTGVELYFYDDMETKDWIIGRGINGEYYCPIFPDDPTYYRTLIETGYLQIILKGGVIRLILFLLIAIPAIVLGLFYSRNILSKAAALWIIIALISLYPATVESFSLQYLLVWISIGICFSKNIRLMPDAYVQEKLTAKYGSLFNITINK